MSTMPEHPPSVDGVLEQKVTAEREEGVVVFHIGMRINAFW